MQFLQRSLAEPDTPASAGSAAGRIAVVRGQQLVPLLASALDSGPRDQPWKGLLLEQHRVQRGEIPEHEHPELCLHLQTSGSESFEWWSGGSHAVERTAPGSLILIPPGTRDRLRWTGASDRIIVSLRQGSLAELAEQFGAAKMPVFQGAWTLSDAALQSLVMEMAAEARNGWPLGSLYADLLSMGLRSRLLRSHTAEPLTAPFRKAGFSVPRLRKAMEYITAHLAEDLSLETVAAFVGVSASHFAHAFRSSTGQTPYQYLLDQRIARAKDLLRSTGWTVQTISAQSGFGSPVNFVRSFRQRTGATPQAWRRQA